MHSKYLRWFFSLTFFVTNFILSIPRLSEAQTPPYAPSAFITGVMFDDSSIRLLAPGSDNWPLTWASNGHQYTTWGDGGGFGGTDDDGRASLGIGRVEGGKDSYEGQNVAGGKGAPCESPFAGKSEGILALGNTLYLWRNGDGSGTAAFKYSRLYRSDDLGCTWIFTGLEFSKTSGYFTGADEGFFSPTFLQFGQGYSEARDNYVYIYAPEIIDPTHWNIQVPGRIALMRVEKSQIEQKAAYQFYAGLDGNGSPLWVKNISLRVPVWQDPLNGTHRMAVSYNPMISRYLLTTMTVDRNGWISMYDAPEPWGPWTTVLFEQNMDRWGSKVVIFNFPNKWLSSDGKSFVMVYTRNDQWASINGIFMISNDSVPPAAPTNLDVQ